MGPIDRDAAVAAWCDRDRKRAVLRADREVIDASASLRSLIVELIQAADADAAPDGADPSRPADELYDACAMLGRLFAQRGGSPTLASATLDHAAEALGVPDSHWLVPARAAVAEGFTAQLVDDARRDAMNAWEYPSCGVPLGEAAIALAAGHPSDDDEIVAAWAARVAKAAALQGIRRAVVSGGERARAALLDALALVGIEVHSPPHPRSKP
jgi:hypothetical protein